MAHGWWRIENQCMHGSVRTPASATTLGTYGVRQMLAPIASSTRVHAAPCRSTVAAYVIRPQISQQGLCVRAERSLRSSQACVRCLSCKRMEPSHSAPPCTSTVDRRRALGSRQQAVGRSPLLHACNCNAPVPRLRLLVSFAAAALPVPACLPVHCMRHYCVTACCCSSLVAALHHACPLSVPRSALLMQTLVAPTVGCPRYLAFRPPPP